MIIVDVLGEEIRDHTQSAGSTYYREPLDVVIGFIDDEGDFLTYYLDSRKLRRAPAP
jgi:hypothetical protein